MDQLFGLSMDTLLLVIIALLLIVGAILGVLAWRQPLFFRLGLRNIPRRRAQTVLIVVGLMLSTLIISSAFTTGDTLSNSLRNTALQIAGRIDHLIQYDSDPGRSVSQRDAVIPQQVADDLQAEFADRPEIQGFTRAIFDNVAMLNRDSEQLLPISFLLGLDPAEADAIGGIPNRGGGRLNLSDLEPGSIILNETAATELAAEKGHQIEVGVLGELRRFTLVDIAEDTLVSGKVNVAEPQGGVINLLDAQRFFDQEGRVTGIGVTAVGGVTGALRLSDQLDAELNAFLDRRAQEEVHADVPLQDRVYADERGESIFNSDPFKQDSIDDAEEFGSVFTTLFLLMGLFSIAAGILLIFLIFVLLAEERKPEMGIARAVGMRRWHLVQTYLAEGMAYNLGAALIGTVLGIIVAFFMIAVLNNAFQDFGFEFKRHVEPRSVVVAAGLGIVITFITVTISSFRVSLLNIVAAIRDIPESRVVSRRPISWLGLITTTLGLLLLPTTIITTPLGILLFPIVGPPLARRGWSEWLIVPAWTLMRRRQEWWFPVTFFGLIFAIQGGGNGAAWLYLTGLTLAPLGLLLLARRLGGAHGFPHPGRIAHSLAGLSVLFFWFAPSEFHEGVLGVDVEGDVELFFLSGAAMVTAAVVVTMFNLDLLLGLLRRMGFLFGRARPVVLTAAAYPGTSRFRTGMTISMIAIIMFALVTFTTINQNFARLFTSDTAAGGYDIQADANRNAFFDDLEPALAEAGRPDLAERLEGAGVLRIGSINGTDIQTREYQDYDGFKEQLILDAAGNPRSVRPEDRDEFRQLFLAGADDRFIEGNEVLLQARAFGFESDAAVWQALGTPTVDGRHYAVISATAVEESGGFAPIDDQDFKLPDEIGEESTRIPEVTVRISNTASGDSERVTIIGVIDQIVGITAAFPGDLVPTLIVHDSVLLDLYPAPDVNRFLARVQPGFDQLETAQAIEATLRVETVSIRAELENQQDTFNAILALFQGFTALGLLAGLAALGVIAVRAVVERRQQIGVQRAIGFRASFVRLGLELEMSFIALIGLLLGAGLAIALSWRLFDEGAFGSTSGAAFYIPVARILIFFAAAMLATVILTYVPARQASRTTIAEALRYE